MSYWKGFATVSLYLLLSAGAADAADDLRDVRFDQLMGQHVPPNAAFRDETGRTVRIQDYLGANPIILVPGYYRCPYMCPLVTDGLIETLQDIRATAGRDFTVLFYSINPRESLSDAANKKAMDVRQYGRGDTAAGWHFLTGADVENRRLSDAIGYHYAYDPQSGQYAHASGFVVLSPNGTIIRYFFGVNFSSRDLNAAINSARAGRVGSPAERLFLLCFHYNPLTGKYSLAIMNVMRVMGICTVACVGGFVGISFCRERLARGRAA